MGRGSEETKVASSLGVPGELLRQARFVLLNAPDLADRVLAGAKPLDAALAFIHPEPGKGGRGKGPAVPPHPPKVDPTH